MSRLIILCVVLGGCGFQARASGDDDGGGSGSPPIDAAPGDGPVGVPVDGATDCFPYWLGGALRFSAPQELTSLSSTGSDRDPWLSNDGLRLYFASTRAGTSDIYLASRAGVTQPFGTPTQLVNLRTTDHEEDRASLTSDEKMLVLASDRAGNGKADIYLITRNATTEPFGTPLLTHMGNVNGGGGSSFDPFLTADGLKLYLSPDPPGGTHQQIAFTTRTDATADFATPVLVPGINNVTGAANADPAVSLDDRIIMFSSDRASTLGPLDLWYATRPSSTQSFGTPVRIPDVNGASADGDPMLSADGCDLYFSSTRNGGSYHLFHAQVIK